MAKTVNTTIKFTGQFDSSGITKGLQEIKKQMSNTHIGEDLRKQLETALSKVEANIPALEKLSAKGEYNTKDLETFQKLVQEVSKDMQTLNKLASEADFTKSFSPADTEKIKQFEKQLTTVENKIKSAKQEIIKNFSDSEQGKINGKNNATLNSFIEQLISVPPDQIESKLNEIIKEAEIQADNAVEKLQQDFQTKAGHKTGKEGFIDLLFGKDSGVTLKEGKTLNASKVTGDEGAYSVYNKIRDDILKLKQDASADDIKKILENYSNFVEKYFNVPEGKQSILANIITPEILNNLQQFTGPEGIEKLKTLLGEEQLKILADGEAEKLRLTQEQAAFLSSRLQELVQAKQLTVQQAQAVTQALSNMNNKIEDGTHSIKNMEVQSAALEKTFGGLAHRIANSVSALTIFNKGTQIVRNAINSVKELDAAFTQIAIVSEQTNEQAWQMFDSFNKLAKQYSITTKDLTEGAKLFYQQGLNAADTMKMVEASTVSAALGEVTMTEAANTLTAAIQGYNESAAVAMDYTDKIAMVGAVSAADFNELSTAMEKTASSAYTAGIDFDHLLGYLGKMIEVTREAPANLGTAMKTIIARFEDMKKDPNALIDGASANKVETALATIGIALRDAAGEFRPLQEVFDELGMKWDTLTRNQQAYIATVAAGSRQQSRFLAMMNNYDRTLDLITESQNSAGAAAEQYAIYQDSAAAATARLSAAWEEFYSKIVNSEQIIWVINSLEKLVETMSKIGPVGTAIGATVGALGLNTLGKVVLPQITKSLAGAVSTGKVASITLGGILKSSGALIVTFGKILLVLAAVTAAIYVGVKAWKAWQNKIHEQENITKNLANQVKELNEQIGESSNKIDSLEKLMERYEELDNKLYRTKEEQEELNSTIEKINNISDRAIVSIDKQGNAHLNNADSIKKEIEAEKELIKFNANKKFNKTNQLLSRDNLTAESAREAGLEEYANYLEKSEDEQAKLYKEIEKLVNTPINKDALTPNQAKFYQYVYNDEISKAFEEMVKDNSLDKFLTENFSSGREYSNIKNLNDYYNFITTNSGMNGKNLEERFEKGNILLEQYLISQINDEYIKAVQSLENEDYSKEEKIKALNQALQEYFSEIANYSEAGMAFFQLMNSGLSFGDEQIDYAYNNFEQYYKEHQDAIKEYLHSNKEQEDIDKLLASLNETTDSISQGLIEYSEKAKEQAEEALQNRKNKRADFIIRNAKEWYQLYGSDKRTGESNIEDFINNNEITDADLIQLEAVLKLDIDENSKRALFDKLQKDTDDEFQQIATKYINSLTDGITDESEKLREQLHDILVNIDISEEDVQKILEDFVPTYNELLESRIDESFSSYNTTRKGISDLTSLKSKEKKQFLSDNEEADKYFEYNEDGEEYLNILGKIILLEQQRSTILKEINEKIELSKIEISDNEKEIERINNLGEEASEEEKTILKTLEEKNRELKESNNLYEKQKSYIEDTANLQQYESMALQSNVNKAQKTADNIKAIAEAWTEYQQGTSDSNLKAISTLNQLDASYQSLFMTVSENGEEVFTLNQDIVDQMIDKEKEKYQEWRKTEIQTLEAEKEILIGRAEALESFAEGEKWTYDQTAEDKEAAAKIGAESQVSAEKQGFIKGISNASEYYQSLDLLAQSYFQDVTEWSQNVYENITNPNNIKLSDSKLKVPVELDVDSNIDFEDFDPTDTSNKNKELARKLANQYRQRIAIIETTIARLGDLSPEFQKTYDKAIKNAAKGGEKAIKDTNKAIEDTLKALEDLDDLIIELKHNLKDITIDYNPFTDLFEAWEHEWDYYYNIKRLISQIQTQGKYINNIISADYTSADQKVQAHHAKIGNLVAAMSANDAYITSLRTGMTQTGVELMKEFGEYYEVDPKTLQLYQHDTSLEEINKAINDKREEIYKLQKLQNEKENNLNLENTKLEALEEQKSAYEDILSTIDSQIDSLKNNENITVDIKGLEKEKKELTANIEISQTSIDEQKDKIKKLEGEIEDIEINVTLKEQEQSDLEKFVDRMESKVSEYEKYWETLNETITNQQEILQQINDEYNIYRDVAISTQQEIYDAIVENYQNEIDQKKEQYDYLKQLDNDYLNSVKDNINKERQAREDSNKQKSYQQNLQRAQLLQMDTSGAYRSELANLNKEIESQRQDLYDDLVDKQVEALETEIEKRHELYDMEVAALEERLAYMQENAILLWEMVNEIVANGSESMMATLENTLDYINSSEFAKQKQRTSWENNVKMTFDGVQNGVLVMLNGLIDAGNAYIEKELPEIGQTIDDYTEVYATASDTIKEYNDALKGNWTELFGEQGKSGVFVQILNNFMTEWNGATNKFTGYMSSWDAIVEQLKTAMTNNVIELEHLNEEFEDENGELKKGSILLFKESLEKTSEDMYKTFLEERQKYKDELTILIKNIQDKISAAVKDAADVIKKAVDSIRVNKSSSGNSGGDGTKPSSDNGGGGVPKLNNNDEKYKINFLVRGVDFNNGETETLSKTLQGYNSPQEAINAANDFIEKWLKENKLILKSRSTLNPVAYKKGGLADFTGPAWLDGTKSRPERILSPRQTKLFESMVSSLEQASNNSNINSSLGSSYNIGDINTSINVASLDSQTDINKVVKAVEDKIIKSIRNRVTVSINKGV